MDEQNLHLEETEYSVWYLNNSPITYDNLVNINYETILSFYKIYRNKKFLNLLEYSGYLNNKEVTFFDLKTPFIL